MTLTKITPVVGNITPIAGTRLRIAPSTYTTVLISAVGSGKIVEIDQTILYLETDPAFPSTMKNDLWGRVISIGGVPIKQIKDDKGNLIIVDAFMAINYHSGVICTPNYIEVAGPVDPPIPPTPVYPDFILVGPAGAQKKYVPEV